MSSPAQLSVPDPGQSPMPASSEPQARTADREPERGWEAAEETEWGGEKRFNHSLKACASEAAGVKIKNKEFGSIQMWIFYSNVSYLILELTLSFYRIMKPSEFAF